MAPRKTIINNKQRTEPNPNDLWGHAIPIESKREEFDLLAEAQFMRELYLTYLPGDTDKDHINSYFDRIDDSIKAKEPISKDDFDPAHYTCAGASPEDGGSTECDNQPTEDRQYWYYSADLFKKRASGHPLQSGGEDVDHTESLSGQRGSAHDKYPLLETLPSIPQRTDSEDSEDEW